MSSSSSSSSSKNISQMDSNSKTSSNSFQLSAENQELAKKAGISFESNSISNLIKMEDLVSDANMGDDDTDGKNKDDDMNIDNDEDNAKPSFNSNVTTKGVKKSGSKSSKKDKSLKQIRRIIVPQHRFSPLKKVWQDMLTPLVEHMKLQVRMNVKKRAVEIRLPKEVTDSKQPGQPDNGTLQKASDFVRAFCMGFELADAVALLRLDDLWIDSFEVKDVKGSLAGDHLSRCIGRICGKGGQTKYAIENSTRTRLVVADRHIHILGAFQNIRSARDAVCALILGQPQTKVYSHLRTVTRRAQERL